MSEFYIGYLPKSPAGLAGRTRRVATALLVLSGTLELLFLYAQQPFAPSTFEFLLSRDFEGVIEEHPYPTLVVTHPGTQSRYLLVASGKHGADDRVRGLNGLQVRIRGQLIYRQRHTMLQLDPTSIQTLDGSRVEAPASSELTQVTLAGEIVDTKCYFGVMNPAAGKVHRDCAVRCISGGLPPALLTEQGELYLLLDSSGRPPARDALRPFMAEPVTISGAASSIGGKSYLRIHTLARGYSAEKD